MFTTTSKKGKTYEYDYCRPAIDRRVWAEFVAACETSGQKSKAALEAALRAWLNKRPH